MSPKRNWTTHKPINVIDMLKSSSLANFTDYIKKNKLTHTIAKEKQNVKQVSHFAYFDILIYFFLKSTKMKISKVKVIENYQSVFLLEYLFLVAYLAYFAY